MKIMNNTANIITKKEKASNTLIPFLKDKHTFSIYPLTAKYKDSGKYSCDVKLNHP